MRQGNSAVLLIAAALLMFCGCAKSFDPQNQASLKPGMSKAEVEATMGKPMKIETTPGMEIWSYDRHDPITSRYEIIQLRFQNGVSKDMSKTSPTEPFN